MTIRDASADGHRRTTGPPAAARRTGGNDAPPG